MRICIRCDIEKESSEFSENRTVCKRCRLDDAIKRNNTPEGKLKKKHHSIKRLYGITIQEYLEMVEEQDNLCAICGSPPGHKALAIDHDHDTGGIRGLLCENCNRGLGMFKDDFGLLNSAADYIIRQRRR